MVREKELKEIEDSLAQLFLFEVFADDGGHCLGVTHKKTFVHEIDKLHTSVRVYYLNALNCYVVLEIGEKDYRRFTGFKTLKEAIDYASSKERIKKLNYLIGDYGCCEDCGKNLNAHDLELSEGDYYCAECYRKEDES